MGLLLLIVLHTCNAGDGLYMSAEEVDMLKLSVTPEGITAKLAIGLLCRCGPLQLQHMHYFVLNVLGFVP